MKYFKSIQQRLQLDFSLFIGLIILITFGLVILYSASYENPVRIIKQSVHFVIAFIVLLSLVRIPPQWYRLVAPAVFIFSLILLAIVLFNGVIGKGAQRWLHLGFIQFQPSELVRISLPMMLAWYLDERTLPPSFSECLVLVSLILIPVLMVAKQPDLGTALLILVSGSVVLVLAGIQSKLIIGSLFGSALLLPFFWSQLHTYQKQRIFTFIYPEQDPLGKGYHIIQSKIAIGSGGIWGKGWLKGTQSHLHFLPEETTDFIFAVCSEEFGLLGVIALIAIYLWITFRGFAISLKAQGTFNRLLAGTLSLNFFLTVFVNIGMVCGILPVVGVPLPLISYGGTSLITWAAAFAMIMSIHTHAQKIHLHNHGLYL